MLHVTVCWINVEVHMKLFKFIWLVHFACRCLFIQLVFITWPWCMLEWWNDAYRSIFHLHWWESVKLIQFCGKMDIFHYYDLQHWKFFIFCLQNDSTFAQVLAALEIQSYRPTSLLLLIKYVEHQAFHVSVPRHFESGFVIFCVLH